MNSEFIQAKAALELEIKFLEREIKACIQERDFKFAKLYQKALWRTKLKLKLLNAFAKKNNYLDKQEIDDALHELNAGNIASFSIILQPYKDFYLNFSLTEGKTIKCELPTEDELFEAYVYVYIAKMKRNILALGFKEAGAENRLCVHFDLSGPWSSSEFKSKIAILMFEILHIDINQPAHLVKRYNKTSANN